MNQVVNLWCRGVARIINMRIRISGDMPDGSAGLVVSNHLGYIDIITHGAVFSLRYSPKSDIAKWPFVGWVVGLSHPVWIDRSFKQATGKALDEFMQTLKHGMSLIVYPEGTSSDGKSGILPFKSALFESAVKGDIPVYPVLTRYREAPGRGEVAWYGDMTFLPHLWRVLGLPSIESELHLLPPVFSEGRSRKEMASYVRDTMLKENNRITRRNYVIQAGSHKDLM
ncbi:MAG: lysophospholipid acyltransferase family protein, partial [Candidatus Omnitrophota bacterium]